MQQAMNQKEKKRILFFVPLPPPITGAGLRNKSLVESSMLNETFQIKVIPFNFAGEVDDIGKFSFTKVLKSFQRGFLILAGVIQFRPHLVYFNFSLYGYALYRDTIYATMFKLLDCKILYHLRTQGVKKQSEQSAIKRRMFRFVFRNTQVVCLSEYMAKDIQNVYSGTPIVVNNGVEDVSHKYPIKSSPKSARTEILFVGHLWKFKGIYELLEALSLLKSKNLEFHATIVGPEGDVLITDLVSRTRDLDLQDHVLIAGPKEGDEKHQLFRDADIFVLPTHWEAFPGVILEAMQFSLPVVATREGAIPEIVDDGDTGLLIHKQDANDLAEKLKQMITDPLLREAMGLKGRIKFEQRYALNLFEKNMKASFEHVLTRR